MGQYLNMLAHSGSHAQWNGTDWTGGVGQKLLRTNTSKKLVRLNPDMYQAVLSEDFAFGYLAANPAQPVVGWAALCGSGVSTIYTPLTSQDDITSPLSPDDYDSVADYAICTASDDPSFEGMGFLLAHGSFYARQIAGSGLMGYTFNGGVSAPSWGPFSWTLCRLGPGDWIVQICVRHYTPNMGLNTGMAMRYRREDGDPDDPTGTYVFYEMAPLNGPFGDFKQYTYDPSDPDTPKLSYPWTYDISHEPAGTVTIQNYTAASIIYDPGPATSGTVPAPQEIRKGMTINLRSNTGGLAWGGGGVFRWYDEVTDTLYTEGASYTATRSGDITLYAAWV